MHVSIVLADRSFNPNVASYGKNCSGVAALGVYYPKAN
jgi:hypothetical protein